MMLMEPASKVSVPLEVVRRTLSNVPDNVFEPLLIKKYPAEPKLPTSCITQNPVDEFSKLNMAVPLTVSVASAALFIGNPDVDEIPAPVAPVP